MDPASIVPKFIERSDGIEDEPYERHRILLQRNLNVEDGAIHRNAEPAGIGVVIAGAPAITTPIPASGSPKIVQIAYHKIVQIDPAGSVAQSGLICKFYFPPIPCSRWLLLYFYFLSADIANVLFSCPSLLFPVTYLRSVSSPRFAGISCRTTLQMLVIS